MSINTSPIIRTANRSILAREQGEGVGARVRRSIGTKNLDNLDPFLMLDHSTVSPPAGFSDHPHRGFETVTYMIDGEIEHEDFTGHRGRIGPGDLQWMTAGRGIVHAEVPVANENTGLQLWVNLPSKHKMMEPRYQELRGSQLPVIEPSPGVIVKLIAGEAFGQSAKVLTLTPICYFDVTQNLDTTVNLPVPSSWNTFLYLIEGSILVGSNNLVAQKYHCVVLDSISTEKAQVNHMSEVRVTATSPITRFIFLGGEPIGEPIVQHGPFVMNTRDEIRQAMEDYQKGKNGFERALTFRSEISARIVRI